MLFGLRLKTISEWMLRDLSRRFKYALIALNTADRTCVRDRTFHTVSSQQTLLLSVITNRACVNKGILKLRVTGHELLSQELGIV